MGDGRGLGKAQGNHYQLIFQSKLDSKASPHNHAKQAPVLRDVSYAPRLSSRATLI